VILEATPELAAMVGRYVDSVDTADVHLEAL
jgi:hypothetical protein